MKKILLLIALFSMSFVSMASDNQMTMNPNKVKYNNYSHKELPASLLPRIKATTDVFEIVDGISYKKAIDLYKRDLDPESNLLIWEEMANVYKDFCKSRCNSHSERMDVYRALLLRSRLPTSEAIERLETKVITRKEAIGIMSKYTLKPQPIAVIQK
jgi:hypothetical protein